MTENESFGIQSKMNPWKAACLSWLLPGMGQAYSNHWLRAVAFFVIYISLYITFLYVLCYSSYLAGIIVFFSSYIFPVWSGLDVVYCSKKSRKNYADESGHPGKNPWLAVFLSLVFPGLGYAYLRRWFSFIICSIAYISLNLLPVSRPDIIVFAILFKVIVCIHVYIIPGKAESKKDLFRFVVLAILLLFFVRILLPPFTAKYLMEASPGEGTSMEPTFGKGDMIIINKLAYAFDNPKAGDIVIIDTSFLKSSRLPSWFYLLLQENKFSSCTKRIVAVGGDIVEINNEGIYVNNILQRKFASDVCIGPNSLGINESEKIERLAVFKPYKVPEDCFFVVGDNIEDSFDSRYFGSVPRNMIIGKVVKIYPPI